MLKKMECRYSASQTYPFKSCSRASNFVSCFPPVFLLLTTLLPLLHGESKKTAREEGQFDIYVGGKVIGHEKFSITSSMESVSSNSLVELRNPEKQSQSIRMETQLDMDGQYLPRAYRLQTNVDGQKGTITGSFVPSEAAFVYEGSGRPRKMGIPVGDRYIILDTNIFHHFSFVARLFDFSGGKSQSIEAVIPQELDGGMLKVSDSGVEVVSVKGKKLNLHRLKVDTGQLQIDLWVDDARVLYKIALPAKHIEVIRDR
jgi:hypothetical protein